MSPNLKISIGMPVYNGGQTIKDALEALLNQTYKEFELIISDNSSTDETQAICEDFASRDGRIRYVRQPKNLGSAGNFKYVLDEAVGEYFLWAAADDIRSKDFLEVNLEFLENNPDYVASTSPNIFEGQDPKGKDLVTFALDAKTPEERVFQFFDNCWQSNGIFYSLIRTKNLKECDAIGESYLASDWSVNIFLSNVGKIYRHQSGMITLGIKGLSNNPNFYKLIRTEKKEILIPFFHFSHYALKLSKNYRFMNKLALLNVLFRLNMFVLFDKVHASLYRSYKKIKP